MYGIWHVSTRDGRRAHRRLNIPGVSVIIPAYNASRWLNETLATAANQTFTDIEIIVVDDGSTDDTAAIVERWAGRDSRIRLIRQQNGGVARARNTAIAAASAPFVAPLDADDLWHPTRLEKHMAAFAASDDDVGVVYSPYRTITPEDLVWSDAPHLPVSGAVFEPQLCENIVGNGSGIMVRTSLLKQVGGYSSTPFEHDAQGCEDWLVQLKLAYICRFVFVPEYLIGYRDTEDNMSSDLLRMRKSAVIGLREVEAFATGVSRPVFWWPQGRAVCKLAYEYLRKKQFGKALRLLAGESLRNPIVPVFMPLLILMRLFDKLRRRIKAPRSDRPKIDLQPFYEVPTGVGDRRPVALSSRLWIRLYTWLSNRRLRREAAIAANSAKKKPAQPLEMTE